ncbi:MAG TPA: IS4 family transposase [Thermoanaerobaculia bacterium]|nr:IS4 family transposase [Thermoanaerobaculia bacterium]
MEAIVVGGREFSASVLERIRSEVRERPALTRAALAREVCEWLNWRQPNGRWRAASCRVALGRLAQRGVVDLPEPRRRVVRSQSALKSVSREWVELPIDGAVQDLGDLDLVRVQGSSSQEALLWKDMIAAHHYCGYQPLVGAQIRYLIGSARGWLGALGFSAAAWHLRDRDRFIGWSPRARHVHLPEVVANSRFLLLPWVSVPNLASKVLALASRRLSCDWQETYGYPPLLLETYVEEDRFLGTCYQAANWQCVGRTAGRGRQDRNRSRHLPVKAIYLYPLDPGWKERLCREPMRRARPLPPESGDGMDWAEREFGGAVLGDRRLQSRLVAMAQDFYARPQANLPQACGTRAKTKAAYRLLDHDQLTLPQLLATHYASTVERMRQYPVVLAVQDTTFLNYSGHLDSEGLGPIHTKKDGAQGLLLHDTMAFTPEGLPLGLLDAQAWARSPETLGRKAQQRKQLPIEEKESYKWLASFTAAAAAQREVERTQVVSVGDREADIYELFQLALRRADHQHLLIRAGQDRLVDDGHQHLWETVGAQPVVGYQAVQASRRRGYAARVAHLAVRFAEVEILPPKKRHLGRPSVRVWAVLAREEEPPPGAQPLEWLLLTTLPVSTAEQAAEKLLWYTRRWSIEVYHRTLKSGCRIEERQLATASRLQNCLAIDMVVAWRIHHLTHLGRETPDLPCTVYFDDLQWQALHGFIHRNPIPPPQPPTLRQAIRMVASLGGFLGRKGDGEPGTKSIWLGLQRLDDIAAAWAVFSAWARPP